MKAPVTVLLASFVLLTSVPARSQAPDSLVRTTFPDSARMARLFAIEQFPLIRGSNWSGVIPVESPTEVPDPNHDYRLLFEFTAKNPDSLAAGISQSLDEVARILNLHIASGIPASRIFPVVVVHGPGLEALTTNEAYRRRHGIDNPNLGIIADLTSKAGAKFIACGQAMAFFAFDRGELLDGVKISITAQTVLSNYRYNGYLVYTIEPEK